MKLKICVEIETKNYSFEELTEELGLIKKLGITEKNFDSRKAEICEHLEKEGISGADCPFEKVKISLVKMGR